MKMEDFKKRPFYLDEEQIEWVNHTLSEMTEDEKIGQIFTVAPSSYNEKRLDTLISKYKVGGIACRQMPADTLVKTVSFLQSHTRIPLLIAANLKEGANNLISEGTKVGSQLAVAACKDYEKKAAYLGGVSGREARLLGCNWTITPVCDLARDTSSTGTFGSDPEVVRKCAVSYIYACQAMGVATAPRNFPGGGQVSPLSNEWDKTYGEIYRSAIEAGTMSIMTSSQSREILQGLLRENLGFNGLILSDATAMDGSEIPQSIEDGVDNLLCSNNFEDIFEIVKDSLFNRRLSQERLDEAVFRTLSLKACLRLSEGWRVFPDMEDFLEARKDDQSRNLLEP